jgi:CubicO group peptidase (beta-lactamase class C family)
MGAGDEADLTVDPAGTAVISGGLCATARDYARVGALVAADGVAAGRPVVPAAWVRSLGRGDPGVFASGSHGDQALRWTGYARKWWSGERLIAARGIHGQLVAVECETGVVVAILSSCPDELDPVEERGQLALVQAGVAACAGGTTKAGAD